MLIYYEFIRREERKVDSLEWGRSNRRNRIKNLTHEERNTEDPDYARGYRDGWNGELASWGRSESYAEGWELGKRDAIEKKAEDARFQESASPAELWEAGFTSRNPEKSE